MGTGFENDIVITGLQSWDIDIGSNCKNIALEFSKHNRVLYINPPADRLTALRSSTKKNLEKNQGLIRINKNLWVLYPVKKIESISRLPLNALFDLLNRHNNRVFAREIKKAVQQLGFNNFVHFCDSDMFRSYYLKDILKPAKYIYYTRDNLLAVKYWQTQGKRIEPKHIAKADYVMANSAYLAELASRYNPYSYFIGQGCDLSAYSTGVEGAVPDDIRHISGTVIGYIGAIKTLRLDINIIECIATQKPDWNIVLIGPEDETFAQSRLHNFKNIHFPGIKKEKELPLYLKAFDVAINPQILNEVTIGNYPRKIDEYLAMGKAVVATNTVTMGYFSDFVSLVNSPEEWVPAIENELMTNNAAKQRQRSEFASQHTWENNVKEIYRLLNEKK